MGFCNFDRFLVLLTLSAQCSSRQAASILTFNDSSTCLKFKLNDRLILIEPIHHCLIECFTFIWTRFFYDIIRTSIVEVQSHVFFSLPFWWFQDFTLIVSIGNFHTMPCNMCEITEIFCILSQKHLFWWKIHISNFSSIFASIESFQSLPIFFRLP